MKLPSGMGLAVSKPCGELRSLLSPLSRLPWVAPSIPARVLAGQGSARFPAHHISLRPVLAVAGFLLL